MTSDPRYRLLYDSLRELSAHQRPAGRYRHQPLHADSNFTRPQPGPAFRLIGSFTRAPRHVLGISAFYHDSAAALIVDGALVAAAQEERFSRRKHDARLPRQAIDFCLRQAGLELGDIDLVSFYEEPFLKLDRLMQTALARRFDFAELQALGWFEAVERNAALSGRLADHLGFQGPVCFVQHHLSHAASAFYASPFPRAACLVLDGVGEWATTTLAACDENGIQILAQIDYPHSLGLLYSAVTAHLGFAANSDEYKVMALASYGRPGGGGDLSALFTTFPDGSFHLGFDPLSVALGSSGGTGDTLGSLLGIPPRAEDGELDAAHEDLARSLQDVTERTVTGLLHRLHALTGARDLVMAGGVALNGVANYRAFTASPFRDVFIQPAAGDAGGALGAALYGYYQVGGPQKFQPGERAVFDPYLGPEYEQPALERFLSQQGIPHRVLPREELPAFVARELAKGRVVGWFQGRMEFGPRALGSRSLLASARDPGMKDTLNRKVKLREGFRPFAPIVPEEDAERYFPLRERLAPLYSMLFVVPTLATAISQIPASVHVDGTARPQLVSRDRHPLLYSLLRAFERETGDPVLINTSFNLAGEPIVCSPADAYKTFRYSEIDLLVLGDCIVDRPR